MHKVVLVILLLATVSANAQDASCTSLRNDIYSLNSDKEKLKPHIKELAERVSQKDNCARNLLGRMYAEGYYFDKDDDRAYAIFYELSNVGYAPAQYNLAFTLTQKQDVEPKLVFVYLQGIPLI
jgi:TPR repeat protein